MKATCSTCKNAVELKDGYLRQHRTKPGTRSKWCENGGTAEAVNERMVEGVDPGVPTGGIITDHHYDSGPVNTGAPCIAWATGKSTRSGDMVARSTAICGKLEHEHRYSEYVDRHRNPGDMHEPKPYTHDLDWDAGVVDRFDTD